MLLHPKGVAFCLTATRTLSGSANRGGTWPSSLSPCVILVWLEALEGPANAPIQNNSEQFRTIQIQPKDLIQFAPLKSGVATSIWRQEGYMAPKPKPATVGMVLAMALTILAAMTWAVAQPSLSLIYRPELPLLY